MPRRVVVMGTDADAVGQEVSRRRAAGERVAGFVGEEEAAARAMGDELLGGLDELVVLR